ncbi:MAG: F0F1 ATP synthase subunit delta [Methylacidiphilales bacterium]|nr:F0F1 ATP synthase subunit delta [Candidatus Methylacidiphilales bacterium]
MKIDRHARQTAKRYFRACLRPDGSFDEQAIRDIVNLVVTERPRNHLGILNRLFRLVEIAIEERTVRVESATPLPDQGASVFRSLEQRYGPAARTSYEQNPALLGGLRIRRGSNIWDGTLSKRLERLEQAFS